MQDRSETRQEDRYGRFRKRQERDINAKLALFCAEDRARWQDAWRSFEYLRWHKDTISLRRPPLADTENVEVCFRLGIWCNVP